ncbi:MAG: lysophospholipid acyltransferase family protein, partial [Anaerolineae bacterium]
MKFIRGYYRICLALVSLLFGGTLIILTGFLPIEIKEYRLSFWMLKFTGWSILRSLRLHVDCPDIEIFRKHEGFVFPNHVTYLDILVLVSVAPMRFLAKDEVKNWPIVGLAAKAIGCAFVKREDKSSREAARASVAQLETFPPIALYPEGKRGPGHELLPFRYGAFDIVVQGQKPYLIAAIVYDPLEIAIWRRGEHVVKAIWRVASYGRPVQVRLLALETVQPQPDDDPVQLSIAAHDKIAAELFGEETLV